MRIGLAGLGFMGAMHLTAWRTVPGAQVVAAMSSDPKKLTGDLTGVGGNLGGTETSFDLSSTRKYRELKDLLADREIDAIDICLPTHLHSTAALAALKAGKYVFLEKPLALNFAAASEVVKAAQGKIFMVGHVLRFMPEYVATKRLIEKKQVRSAFFRRRCAAPTWSTWLTDTSKSGGALMDLLIHDLDYCLSVWGMPESLSATGHQDMARGIDVSHIELHYPGQGPVVVTGGWHHPKSYPFSMEFTISTDEATLDWKNGNPLKRYSDTGVEQTVEVEAVDLFSAELAYFAECATKQTQPDRCPPEQSAQAVLLAELAGQSRTRGGKEIQCQSNL